MKILITGSAGYIGSCLYEYLKTQYDVYGIDKTNPPIKIQKKFFKCNLLNQQKLNNIISSIKPSFIIHLAAKSTIDFIKDKKSYIDNNLTVTQNLLKSMKKK